MTKCDKCAQNEYRVEVLRVICKEQEEEIKSLVERLSQPQKPTGFKSWLNTLLSKRKLSLTGGTKTSNTQG